MTEIVVNNTIVDISDDVQFSLNFAIADILMPEKRNTSFSKTIKLPGTKTNNILFSHIFDLTKQISSSDGLVNFSPDFNPNLKADCKIFKDNILQLKGILQLVQINRVGESYEYEVVVFGTLKNIMLNIGEKKLEELDMSEYNHAFTYTNMKESWDTRIQKNGANYTNFVSGNPKGEGYVYPTIDYGYTNSPASIKLENSYPAIYLREYMTKIFAYAGFTWTSAFFDSVFFKRLIIPFNKKEAILTDTERLNRSFLAKIKQTAVTYSGDAPNKKTFVINFNNDSTDGAFDTTNQYTNTKDGFDYSDPIERFQAYDEFPISPIPSTCRISKKGSYDFSTTLDFQVFHYDDAFTELNPQSVLSRVTVTIMKGTTGSIGPIATTGTIETTATSNGFVGTLKASNISCNVGDYIFVTIAYTQSTNPNVATADPKMILASGSSFYNTPVANPILLGDLMYLNSAIPKGIPVKDLFMSVIKMFNLYVQPDPDNETNLLIEPLIDFYSGNTVIDWTDKIDYSKQSIIKPCSAIEGKDYIFRYKPDNDYYNADYLKVTGSNYGEKNISIANDFLKGQKVIEPIFSPTPSVGIIGSKMVIPRIVNIDNNTGAVTPHSSNIRLLYYGGVLNPEGSWSWHGNNGALVYSETTYAYAGHLDHPFTPTLDLLFDTPKQIYWGGPSNIGTTYTDNNVYNKYWSQFVSEITDKNSKVVTLYARLRTLDIFSLNFKNFIHVAGVNYRLNKVIDYNPTSEEVCKIELSKIKGGATFTPTTTGVTGTSQDPILFDIVEGGEDEIRSPSAYAFIHLIDGSKDAIIGISGSGTISLINGGVD